MCRVADGPLRPGELDVSQAVVPLVSWVVNTRDGAQASELHDHLAIELHFSDSTIWTGEAYPVAESEPAGQPPATVRLRGTGPLRENSIPLHADVVMQRLRALSPEPQE